LKSYQVSLALLCYDPACSTIWTLRGAPARRSLDHLYLDQDAIPTLVEVKRSQDTRIRREVVGQMLDYASNAVVYWPVEEIRKQFEKTCEISGKNPDAAGKFKHL